MPLCHPSYRTTAKLPSMHSETDCHCVSSYSFSCNDEYKITCSYVGSNVLIVRVQQLELFRSSASSFNPSVNLLSANFPEISAKEIMQHLSTATK